MNADLIFVAVGYLALSIPFYLGIRASTWLLKIEFVDKTRLAVEKLDNELIAAEDIVTYKDAIKALRASPNIDAGVVAFEALSSTVRDLREHNSLGKKIAAAEHIMEMWRNFAESVSDTWFDGMLFAAVVILGYLLNVREELAAHPDLVIVITALKRALKEIWLPGGEVALTLFACRGYQMLKKHTNFYAKELKLR